MHRYARGALTIFAALLAGLLAMGACSCSSQTESTRDSDDGAAAVSSDESLPQIKIGTSYLEPFFYMGRDGEYAGIDAEIAKEACRRAGLAPDFVEIQWGDRDESLEDGAVDCIWSGFAINDRESEYLWTDAYLDTDLALLVADRSPIASLDGFSGPDGIAVRANSIAEQVLLEGGTSIPSGVDIHCYGTSEMAKSAFVKGFTDGWVSYRLVLDQVAKESPGRYRYLSESLYTLHLGVAFKRGYTGPYYRQINDALASMKQDGTLAQIVARYANEEAGDEN